MSFLDRNVLVDGVRLAYRDRGEGEPVVFVHGTPSASAPSRSAISCFIASGIGAFAAVALSTTTHSARAEHSTPSRHIPY